MIDVKTTMEARSPGVPVRPVKMDRTGQGERLQILLESQEKIGAMLDRVNMSGYPAAFQVRYASLMEMFAECITEEIKLIGR